MNIKSVLIGTAAVAVVAASALAFAPKSGLNPGENISAFHPRHIAGPMAGTDKCFPCTYQARPQVQVWVNGDNAENVNAITKFLNQEVKENKDKEFKAMVVLVDTGKGIGAFDAWAKGLKDSKVAIAVLPASNEAVKAYKFNVSSDVKNTVYVYKNWKVEASMVNLKADEKGLKALDGAISKVIN